jgi:branched-chain amino acid transport system permease protein
LNKRRDLDQAEVASVSTAAYAAPSAGSGDLLDPGWSIPATGGRLGQVLRTPAANSVLVALVGLVVVIVLKGNFRDSIVILALGYAIAAVGMAVQVGYSHQIAFSQSLFVGLGAYGVAALNTKYQVPTWLALVIMVAVAAPVAALLGSLVTRAPGLALAVATLLFPLILTSYVTFSSYLGQTTGLGGVKVLWNGGDFTSGLVRSGGISVLLLGLAIYVCARLLNSGVGLELALVGEDQAIASSLGILNRRRKLEVFVFGSVLATLGGAVYAGTQGFVSPDIFSSPTELTLLVMLYVGGRRSLVGAAVGALAIEFLSQENTWVSTHLLLIEGILLTAVLLFEPEGLARMAQRLVRFVIRLAGGQPVSGGVAHAQAPADGAGPADPGSAAADGSQDRASVVGMAARTTPRSTGVAPASAGTPVLATVELTRAFGGLVAVDHVSIEIPAIGVYGICGPNGAGKSTLFGLIGGAIPVGSGQVLLDGADITHTSAAERAHLGIARTFQAAHLMPDKTALDNVAVACLPSHQTFLAAGMFRRDLNDARDKAYEALRDVGVANLSSVMGGQLTLEGQRMVELARALAGNPKVLLLDEPASGLSVTQRLHLGEILADIGTRTTVVLVEHDLEMIIRLVKKVFMLIDGKLTFEGGPHEFETSPIVRSALMGLIDAPPV